jgi:hypothetical protein
VLNVFFRREIRSSTKEKQRQVQTIARCLVSEQNQFLEIKLASAAFLSSTKARRSIRVKIRRTEN